MADIQWPPSQGDRATTRRDLNRREEVEVVATRLTAVAATGTMRSEVEVAVEALRPAGTALPAPSWWRWRSGVRATAVGNLTYVPAWPSIAQRVIWYVDAVISILLAVRFAFAILGANVASSFGNLISAVTGPVVWPFLRLFNASPVGGVSRLEASTLVAIVVYVLVAWGLATLVGLTLAGRRVAV